VFPFDDSWDLLRDLAVARYETVRAGDLDAVVSTVRSYRLQMQEMARQRSRLPEVARYFRGS
jgi:hypothetical protein